MIWFDYVTVCVWLRFLWWVFLLCFVVLVGLIVGFLNFLLMLCLLLGCWVVWGWVGCYCWLWVIDLLTLGNRLLLLLLAVCVGWFCVLLFCCLGWVVRCATY